MVNIIRVKTFWTWGTFGNKIKIMGKIVQHGAAE
jgi:hypothetical protein